MVLPLHVKGPPARYYVAKWQMWVERLDGDGEMPGMSADTVRRGRQYALRSNVVTANFPAIMRSESLPLTCPLRTANYPAGFYRFTFQLQNQAGEVIDNATAEVPIGESALAEQRRREEQERETAAWVLEQKGKIVILVAGERQAVGAVDQLPALPFRVIEIDLGEQPETRDEDLARLTVVNGLQKLRLKGMAITDAGLEQLSGLTSLRELRLEATSLTGTGFRHLGNLHELETLATGYGTPISDEGLAAIPPLPNLSYFVANTGNMSDEGLRHLTRLQGLEMLRLHWGKLTGEGFRHLTELPKLRVVDADHGQLTNDCLAHLGKIPSLQKLRLDANEKLSDAGLVHLHGLSNLQALSVRETAVTEAGVKAFQAKLPACSVSWDVPVAREPLDGAKAEGTDGCSRQ
jgi:hypothetical protein